MDGVLEQLITTVSGWDGSRPDERAACGAALARMEQNMDAAIALWRECETEASPVANRYTAIIEFGADRAKALHALHLDQKEAATSATEASGVTLRDSLDIAEEIDIIQPYAQFTEDESIAARAAKAIATLESRRNALREARTRF